MRRALLFFVFSLSLAGLGGPTVALAQERIFEISYVPTERAQIAIWIEGADGTFLRTLRLTQATSYRGIGNRPGASEMNSGFRWPYGRREGTLPYWAHRRASAPGAEMFRRVIFQDRQSEGYASRTASDHSRDDYFCLSFDTSTTTRDALDAVTCASTFNSDKGRFVTDADVAAGYSEPAEMQPGETSARALDLLSLYPPRRDVTRCTSAGCFDHADVDRYGDESRRVMPEIDVATMATPPASTTQRHRFTWPAEWPDGDYVVWIEINTEGDYNADWETATPRNPDPGTPEYREYWDYWAMSYGYPYRGQPSVVYSVPFHMGEDTDRQSTSVPTGYGSPSGWGTDAGEMRTMDGSISDDPIASPGSGADRLRLIADARVRVRTEVCVANDPPTDITELAVTQFHERRDAHHFAHLAFRAPEDDSAVALYEVRVGAHPITDEESFMRAQPANAAEIDSVALQVPIEIPPGEMVEVDIGGLAPETRFWIGVRAMDGCNASSAIAVVEYVTPAIQFTTVSPCFVATAAYGTPMADEITALRRFRDRHLRTNAIGRALVSAYEAIGPHLADGIRDHEDARAWVRSALAPIVAFARWAE